MPSEAILNKIADGRIHSPRRPIIFLNHCLHGAVFSVHEVGSDLQCVVFRIPGKHLTDRRPFVLSVALSLSKGRSRRAGIAGLQRGRGGVGRAQGGRYQVGAVPVGLG